MNFSKKLIFIGIITLGCSSHKTPEWEVVQKHPNGGIKISHLNLSGTKDSTFLAQEYYSNGVTKSTITYLDGKADGKAIGYFPNGMPATIKSFVLGFETGWFLTYYKNGIIRSKFIKKKNITVLGNYYFDNGQPTGCLLFDEKGQIIEGEYYYPNGHYRSAGKFYEQMKKGPWREYHENGVLKAAGSYKIGLKRGSWVYYDSLGRVSEVKAH